ncbi:Hint domain-containing protein [Methylobacterium sp. NMS12]|uniref:Hint domain-containing protein n=1 Tax=Methylobacterium sp. NMS12 TaxID=3079766 RepID=UPI003F885152
MAIDFTGGTNSLAPSTGTLNGGLGIAGGATTLRVIGNAPNNLGPVANAGTFDISGTTAGASITTLSGAGGTTLGARALTITNGSTSYSGAISGTGGVAVNGGTQTLTGGSTYSGGTTLGSNGSAVSSTLQLGDPTSAGTGTITFGTMSGTATARLGLNVAAQPTNGGTFANTISNFGSGNEIALAGLTNSSVSYNSANSSITITGTRSGGGQVSENFVLSAPRTTSFATVSDGQGGTIVRAATATNPVNPANPSQPANPAPCYVTGTRIRILRDRVISDVPVEHLAVGDLAVTAAGTPRPIRWIGTRAYPGSTAPPAERPVRIRAGALAGGMPARDLLVSPDHGLWLDGLFVAAGHLVNGSSITRVARPWPISPTGTSSWTGTTFCSRRTLRRRASWRHLACAGASMACRPSTPARSPCPMLRAPNSAPRWPPCAGAWPFALSRRTPPPSWARCERGWTDASLQAMVCCTSVAGCATRRIPTPRCAWTCWWTAPSWRSRWRPSAGRTLRRQAWVTVDTASTWVWTCASLRAWITSLKCAARPTACWYARSGSMRQGRGPRCWRRRDGT